MDSQGCGGRAKHGLTKTIVPLDQHSERLVMENNVTKYSTKTRYLETSLYYFRYPGGESFKNKVLYVYIGLWVGAQRQFLGSKLPRERGYPVSGQRDLKQNLDKGYYTEDGGT